jgi:hypothetical protein
MIANSDVRRQTISGTCPRSISGEVLDTARHRGLARVGFNSNGHGTGERLNTARAEGTRNNQSAKAFSQFPGGIATVTRSIF